MRFVRREGESAAVAISTLIARMDRAVIDPWTVRSHAARFLRCAKVAVKEFARLTWFVAGKHSSCNRTVERRPDLARPRFGLSVFTRNPQSSGGTPGESRNGGADTSDLGRRFGRTRRASPTNGCLSKRSAAKPAAVDFRVRRFCGRDHRCVVTWGFEIAASDAHRAGRHLTVSLPRSTNAR